ncbi:MAG: Holliday junction resolvase RuvX [Clostridia bacterium]|nr:Holliday junction resolvase RuvX [Clostridia bacterium]
MNEQIIGLDIGDVRIGVAVSDRTRLIANPVDVITRVGWGPDCKKILEIMDRYDTRIAVSGLPLNMDGSEGFQARKVRELCAQLEKRGVTVYYQDERLTTVRAEDALLESGMSRQDRKGHVDKVAAAIILQSYLDEERQKPQGAI